MDCASKVLMSTKVLTPGAQRHINNDGNGFFFEINLRSL
jgi:hypothetical protein